MSKGKSKAKPCHMVHALAVESGSNGSLLFDTDDEEIPATGGRMPVAAITSIKNAGKCSFQFKSESSWIVLFMEEHVSVLFNLLIRYNKLKFLAARRSEETGITNHPNYCLFHQMIRHSTKSCRILNETLQALIDAWIIRLCPKQQIMILICCYPNTSLESLLQCCQRLPERR